MRYSGTWLTPEDEVILEALRDHGPASPIDMPDLTAVDLSPAYIEERCTTLT